MRSESRFPAWAWWLIGAVTLLAVSILIFSVVLGIRAGQQQVEIQRRQQIGIALQQATDLQAEGNLQDAFDQYQRVLVLDPSNAVAQQGIKNLLTLATAGTPVATTSPPVTAAALANNPSTPATTVSPVATPSHTPTAPATTTPVTTTVAAAWDKARQAHQAGRWQEALTQLTLLQRANPTFRSQEVSDLLFDVYVNLAGEKDNDDNLEEALQLYGKALELRPTATDLQRERDLIIAYLDVLTYFDVDWPKATTLLEDLYAEEPQYRDVEQRLLDAHSAYGDQLAQQQQWCSAVEEYESALSVARQPDVEVKRDSAQLQCADHGNVAVTGLLGASAPSGLQATVSVTATATAAATPAATVAVATSADSGGPVLGRILYSSIDTVSGSSQIMTQVAGKNTSAQLLLQDAAQPAMRSDGARLAFRNLRRDMGGVSSFDPATSLMLRFTDYAEDSLPSWNPQGSRLVFASNREGDRLWRIYAAWAETDGGTDTLGLGEAPQWHPGADEIVYRGCDPSGNNCGLWTMSGSGTNRVQLTGVPDDDRPTWSPDGSFIVFMGSSRDGNREIYRLDVLTGEITRLTDSTAIDALPVVSPDGAWVAFVSNREAGWKIWVVPSEGGQARPLAPIAGDLGNWAEQGLQWVY